MSAFATPLFPSFASAIAEGLSASQKQIASRYLFDDIGTNLFQIITQLPEYGILRAEDRLLRRYSGEISQLLAPGPLIVNCGPFPGHQSRWLEKVFESSQTASRPMLLRLLNGSAGSVDRNTLRASLEQLRNVSKPGDHILFTADLVKDVDRILSNYKDPAGITAAFHKNLLVRVNRELGGHFRINNFDHKVTWNAFLRRVEFHLVSRTDQDAYIATLGRRFSFQRGETIRSDVAFKFTEPELESLALSTNFSHVKTWMDIESALAMVLWSA